MILNIIKNLSKNTLELCSKSKYNIAKATEEIAKFKIIHGYLVFGNKFCAIAINIENTEDTHYFNIDPEVHNNAYSRAITWNFSRNLKENLF